jgi:hypothetical protein
MAELDWHYYNRWQSNDSFSACMYLVSACLGHWQLECVRFCVRAGGKVCELTLLLLVRTLWRYGDLFFFWGPPLVNDAVPATLNPLLENTLKTISCKLQEEWNWWFWPLDYFVISCLKAPFSWLEKLRNCMGWDVDCMADVLMGFHWWWWAQPFSHYPCVFGTVLKEE